MPVAALKPFRFLDFPGAAFMAHCEGNCLASPTGGSQRLKRQNPKENNDLTKGWTLAAALAATSPAAAGETGIATYYTNPYHPGMIAAHKTLPFGAHVKVTNLDNGRSAVVTIVDRGPFAKGRIIDVSTYAAGVLGFRQAGICHVRLEKI